METFKSPKITINEKYSPIDESTRTAGDSVALVDFATKGPIGEVGTFSTLTNFENTYGKPDDSYLFSHILANKVLNLDVDSSVNFMRIADSTATKAVVPVYNKELSVAKAYLKPYEEENLYEACDDGFLIPKASVGNSLKAQFQITVSVNSIETTYTTEAFGVSDYSNDTTKYIVSFGTLKNEFNKTVNSNLNSLFTMSKVTVDGVSYMLIEAKNITTGIASIKLQEVDASNDFSFGMFDQVEDTSIEKTVIEVVPTTITDNEFNEQDCYLTIEAKYAGTGYNKLQVIKSTDKDYVGETLHTVSIKDPDYTSALETYTAYSVADLITSINDGSNYITITESDETTDENLIFVNGIYVLGEGQLVENSYVNIVSMPAIKGTNGIPTDMDIEKIKALYVEALESEAMKNTDLYDFSIVATPSCGETDVQDAAIRLCKTRGDCEYLVDIPLNYVEAKSSGINQSVKWINGDRGGSIDSSYATAYYGWFPVSTPYSTNPTLCPASVFLAPKMIEIDYNYGPFYVPAGVKNGKLTVTDYTYSPSNTERDTLCYYGSINPIIYSNTRGVMILSQRTCDRTSSPFNRVSSRRMTNKIKKQLRIALENVLFMANSADTRTYASNLIYDIMDPYKNAGMIESYTLDISSGTGSDRNSLYINLHFVPYGLVENIVVNLEISDTSVSVTESTE